MEMSLQQERHEEERRGEEREAGVETKCGSTEAGTVGLEHRRR